MSVSTRLGSSAALLATISSATMLAAGTPASHQKVAPIRDFHNACANCHEGGGFGVRVLSDRVGQDEALIRSRKELAPEVIEAIVRNGIGAMPAMSRIELSDEELSRIIDEMTVPNRSGGHP